MSLPEIILERLKAIEPEASFTGRLPMVQSSSGKRYFAKFGAKRDIEQFTGEAESLKAIEAAAPRLAPRVLTFGIKDHTQPYFISEYKDMSSLTDSTAKVLAKRLATEMHKSQSPQGYGFGVPTYCGATRLENGWFDSWEKCYSAMIGDLITQLRNQGGYEKLCEKAEQVRKRVIPKLLGPLEIEPVLLHGDLWSGNTGVDTSTGQPVIYDPASYYGHNEADLAIARIFGGIPRPFFTEYHTYLPKTEPVDEYQLRGDLYELFHYLNHTLLFGGHYAHSAMAKIIRLLDAVEE